ARPPAARRADPAHGIDRAATPPTPGRKEESLMKTFDTVNPTTGETLKSYPLSDEAGIDATLERSTRAQRDWAGRALGERLEHLARLADLFENRQDELARLMTREMGKPIAQARGEAAKCARAFRYYVENAPRLLAD